MGEAPNKEIKRHNHYVPEMYLNNWANRKKVNTYSLLVPHEKVPVWKRTSIKYAASIDNLYVRQRKGQELDDFEDVFMRRYETPAKVPMQKACKDYSLTSDDWNILIDFVAAQIVRTPAFFFKHQDIMKRIFPKVAESVGERLKEYMKSCSKPFSQSAPIIDNLLPTTIDITGIQADDDNQYVEIGTIIGKSTWLYSIDRLLTNTSYVLHNHKWSIITADEGIFWPTSDDPVICLNAYEDGDYDFGGGWDNEGSEIIMPISPTKALYTQVGIKHPPRMKFNFEESFFLKELIVEHALMYVYASNQDNDIPLIRPRTVDLCEYTRIKKDYEDWYNKYQEGEVPYLEPFVVKNGQQIK